MPAGHQDPAVGEERRPREVARGRHRSNRRPGVRRRVIDLGGVQRREPSADPPGSQHASIGEDHEQGGVPVRGHRGGHAPGVGRRVVDLHGRGGARVVEAARHQDPPVPERDRAVPVARDDQGPGIAPGPGGRVEPLGAGRQASLRPTAGHQHRAVREARRRGEVALLGQGPGHAPGRGADGRGHDRVRRGRARLRQVGGSGRYRASTRSERAGRDERDERARQRPGAMCHTGEPSGRETAEGTDCRQVSEGKPAGRHRHNNISRMPWVNYSRAPPGRHCVPPRPSDAKVRGAQWHESKHLTVSPAAVYACSGVAVGIGVRVAGRRRDLRQGHERLFPDDRRRLVPGRGGLARRGGRSLQSVRLGAHRKSVTPLGTLMETAD